MVTPRVGRSGTVTITANGWLVWHPDPQRDPQPLPPEWVFRVWSDVDLDDDASIMVLVAQRGMVWGGLDRTRDDETTPPGAPGIGLPPVDSTFGVVCHIAEVREQLVTLRGLAQQWLSAGIVSPTEHYGVPGSFWRLLDKGLRPFTPVTMARDPEPLVDLYEAGCWQVYEAIVDGAPARRCPGCGRVFYRKDGVSVRADVKYCTGRCRNAARVRRNRARNQARIPESSI